MPDPAASGNDTMRRETCDSSCTGSEALPGAPRVLTARIQKEKAKVLAGQTPVVRISGDTGTAWLMRDGTRSASARETRVALSPHRPRLASTGISPGRLGIRPRILGLAKNTRDPY